MREEPKKRRLSSETTAQRDRLLEALQDGPLSTVEIREELDILSPAPRIRELRQDGYTIATMRENIKIGLNSHRGVARYVLLGGRVEIGGVL